MIYKELVDQYLGEASAQLDMAKTGMEKKTITEEKVYDTLKYLQAKLGQIQSLIVRETDNRL